MRYFNDKPVELLAPAGNFSILNQVVNTNCDAVYFGGKRFNMRLHRKNYNLSNEELRDAVQIARSKNKKAYITVNNMYTQGEVPELTEYLCYLAEIGPDALIVQDFSVLRLVRQLALPLALHSSVMMNVHNLATVKRLEELGVSRVVMSRELSLAYIKGIAAETRMEFEYFVHGDMCVAHGGQCLYSGILFGSSSNQGRCLKPCRWNFEIECAGRHYQTEFPLAVKDMYLYEHIPELIHHKISCFKIEGRMREWEYLEGLINAYGDAIDRYIADPLSYDRLKQAEYLSENRKRDFSTAYAFGKPGLANINRRMEGTGALYSSGKVFSAATEEPELTEPRAAHIRHTLARFLEGRKPAAPPGRSELVCTAGTRAQAEYCIQNGVDHIYLSADVFLPQKPFSVEAIKDLARHKGTSRLYLCQSRMMFDQDLEEYQAAMALLPELDGMTVSSLGGLALREKRRDFAAIGDYALNIQNSDAWELYRAQGLSGFTISAETRLPDLLDLLAAAGEYAELIVFGSPTVMYLEHDLFENTRGGADMLYLIDEKGFRHPVYRDKRGRNHILLYKDLSYLPFLGELHRAGLRRFRIEASHLDQGPFEKTVNVFLAARDNPDEGEALAAQFPAPRAGFTPGPWAFAGLEEE